MSDRNETEKAAAAKLGLSVFSFRLHLAALGQGPYAASGAEAAPVLRTQADVAEHFGVSRRTVATWKTEGMPGGPGKYSAAAIAAWRAVRYGVEAAGSNHGLPARAATGELARAILRTVAVDVVGAADGALQDFLAASDPDPEIRETLQAAFLLAINRHFSQFRFSEADVDRTLSECWHLV